MEVMKEALQILLTEIKVLLKMYSTTLNSPGQSVKSLNGVNVNLQANFPVTRSAGKSKRRPYERLLASLEDLSFLKLGPF
jgi:hypothetical protein